MLLRILHSICNLNSIGVSLLSVAAPYVCVQPYSLLCTTLKMRHFAICPKRHEVPRRDKILCLFPFSLSWETEGSDWLVLPLRVHHGTPRKAVVPGLKGTGKHRIAPRFPAERVSLSLSIYLCRNPVAVFPVSHIRAMTTPACFHRRSPGMNDLITLLYFSDGVISRVKTEGAKRRIVRLNQETPIRSNSIWNNPFGICVLVSKSARVCLWYRGWYRKNDRLRRRIYEISKRVTTSVRITIFLFYSKLYYTLEKLEN